MSLVMLCPIGALLSIGLLWVVSILELSSTLFLFLQYHQSCKLRIKPADNSTNIYSRLTTICAQRSYPLRWERRWKIISICNSQMGNFTKKKRFSTFFPQCFDVKSNNSPGATSAGRFHCYQLHHIEILRREFLASLSRRSYLQTKW